MPITSLEVQLKIIQLFTIFLKSEGQFTLMVKVKATSYWMHLRPVDDQNTVELKSER